MLPGQKLPSNIRLMSKCRFCGEKTRWLSSAHDECATIAENAQLQLSNLAASFFENDENWSDHLATLKRVRADTKFDLTETSSLRSTLLSHLNASATKRCHSEPMDFAELGERRDALTELNLWPSNEEIKRGELFGFVFMVFGGVLSDVRKGLIPNWDEPLQVDFNLHRDESPVFLAACTDLAEYRSETSGVYQSVGLPSVLGMGYRIGVSNQSSTSNLRVIDEGQLLITTKNIYFGGPRENFRLPIREVLRFEQYTDAVGVYPPYGGCKFLIPLYLGAEVGWFFYGLLTALSRWE